MKGSFLYEEQFYFISFLSRRLFSSVEPLALLRCFTLHCVDSLTRIEVDIRLKICDSYSLRAICWAPYKLSSCMLEILFNWNWKQISFAMLYIYGSILTVLFPRDFHCWDATSSRRLQFIFNMPYFYD